MNRAKQSFTGIATLLNWFPFQSVFTKKFQKAMRKPKMFSNKNKNRNYFIYVCPGKDVPYPPLPPADTTTHCVQKNARRQIQKQNQSKKDFRKTNAPDSTSSRLQKRPDKKKIRLDNIEWEVYLPPSPPNKNTQKTNNGPSRRQQGLKEGDGVLQGPQNNFTPE